MVRILVLSPLDWRRDGLDYRAAYLREVCVRLAQQGHYVSLACAGRGRVPRRVDVSHGVQMIRIGRPIAYRLMAEMFVERMAASGRLTRLYDVVVDAVHGRPLALRGFAGKVPVAPLVFGLARGVRASELGEGQVLAASEDAASEAVRAGVSGGRVVRAPFGVGWCACERSNPAGSHEAGADAGELVAVAPRAGALLGVAGRDGRGSLARSGMLITDRRFAAGSNAGGAVRVLPWGGDIAALSAMLSAMTGAPLAAYCARGYESAAALFGAMGVPVVSPNTRGGRTCIEDGQTGMLHSRGPLAALWGDIRTARGCLRRVMRDPECRAALREGVETARKQRTWDQTTSRILATITSL